MLKDKQSSDNFFPIEMEDHFPSEFFTKPSVHIGSQSMHLYDGDEIEQSYENLHLAGSYKGDVVVMRNADEDYIRYWEDLFGPQTVINIQTKNRNDFLSRIILNDPSIIDRIKKSGIESSVMTVYFPTEHEELLAKKLGITLHGNSKVSSKYGTKIGIRDLAKKAQVPMPEGFIVETAEKANKAFEELFKKHDSVIIKHELSSAGRWMKVVRRDEKVDTKALLKELSDSRVAINNRFIVEAWIQSKASLCAYIEIEKGIPPKIVAGWQQVIDSDGVSYMGAGPLGINPEALASFKKEAMKLSLELQKEGGHGSYGPDFLISDGDSEFGTDQAVLIELNARVPFTAFPLTIVKQVKGKIGSGFFANKINLRKGLRYKEIFNKLGAESLLITKKSPIAKGVVPFNSGLLPWGSFYYVSMGSTFSEALEISQKTSALLSKL